MKPLSQSIKSINFLAFFSVLALSLCFQISIAQAQTCEEVEGINCNALGDATCQVGDCADCAFCEPQLLICDISNCILCGNGALNGDEQCDDGEANSDTEADACRTDCQLPICGDGVVDSGEACDGGADCTAECQTIEEQVAPVDNSCIQGSGFEGNYDANCQGCSLNPHLVSQGFAKDYAGFLGLALFASLAWSLRRS